MFMVFGQAVPDICPVAGNLGDWWLESQSGPNTTVKVTIAVAAAGSSFYTATGIVFTVPPGINQVSLGTLLSVNAGDKVIASVNNGWNHSGLTLKARLQ